PFPAFALATHAFVLARFLDQHIVANATLHLREVRSYKRSVGQLCGVGNELTVLLASCLLPLAACLLLCIA
ncbi:MAG TPA: hypothetical protein VGT81_14460, partial [Casimicrobiaceae bacterium]|nr:hypothetical protein [Casimicrobiaceae bacterium]